MRLIPWDMAAWELGVIGNVCWVYCIKGKQVTVIGCDVNLRVKSKKCNSLSLIRLACSHVAKTPIRKITPQDFEAAVGSSHKRTLQYMET